MNESDTSMLNSVTNAGLPAAQPAHAERCPASTSAPSSAGEAARLEDRLELSDAARARSGGPAAVNARPELVQRIRAEIASDAYLTEDKLDIAVQRMLGDLLDD